MPKFIRWTKAFAIGYSVRGRVARVILMAGLVPLLAISVYTLLAQRTSLEQTADENLQNYAVLEAQAVANVLSRAEANVKVLAANPVIDSPASTREANRAQLKQAQDFFGVFEDITLVDPAGIVITSTNFDYSGSWLANVAYQDALNGSDFAATPVKVARAPSRFVVEFAAPVRNSDDNSVLSVLVGSMNMERVWEALDPVKIGESGFALAFDSHGNLISHPDKELLLSKPEGIQQSLSADAPGLAMTGTDGQSLTGETAPVGLLDWHVGAVQDSAEVYSPANDMMKTTAMVALIVVVLTILGSILFSRGVTSPILRLSAGMKKIAKGRLDHRVLPAGIMELDEISESFNSMAIDLQARMAEQEQSEETIKYLAYHDSLTGLANRTLFKDRATVALSNARRKGARVAVLFIDLDQFKLVNDTVGHALGDELLKLFGERLTTVLRDSDSLARVGGDEFTILLPEISSAEDAALVAARALDILRPSITLAGYEFNVSGSIGIAVYPDHGDDVDVLIRNADTAMYRAKGDGRNRAQFFRPEMNDQVVARVELEADLRHALERDEFVVHYQPQVDIHTGEIIAVEALVRWQHPARGLVQPYEFIPIAEETGMIVPLGEWVLRTACAQSEAWHKSGLPRIRMAVNFSARQFETPRLTDDVERVLKETGLPSEYLDCEITETTAMRDVEFTIKTVRALRDLGVHISVDDFGTGYSSLAYLSQLAVDSVKIDRSFVADMQHGDGLAIVRSIVALAETMNLTTIAEGVESEEQLSILKDAGCRLWQGFLLSKPLPAEALETILRERGATNGRSPTGRHRAAGVA